MCIKNKNTTAEETIKSFENFYNVIISNRVNLTMLETLYDNFASLTYKHTKSHQVISDKETEITDKLLPTLNENQMKLFEKYDILQGEELQDYGLQSFITGVLIANEMTTEVRDFYNNSDNLKSLIENFKKLKKDQSNNN